MGTGVRDVNIDVSAEAGCWRELCRRWPRGTCRKQVTQWRPSRVLEEKVGSDVSSACVWVGAASRPAQGRTEGLSLRRSGETGVHPGILGKS